MSATAGGRGGRIGDQRSRQSVVIAGMGSPYRRDDAAGLHVAEGAFAACARRRDVDDVGPMEDPFDLLGQWDGAALAIVIDAVRTGAPPGTVHVVDVQPRSGGRVEVPGRPALSTHGIGLSGVLSLAVVTGTAPQRVTVVGIEGEDFGRGEGMSAAVTAAVPEAVRTVVALVEAHAPCA